MERKKIFRFFDRYFGIPLVLLLGLFSRTKRRLPIESIHNILFIKLAAIGDSILLIPTLRKLYNSFPNSKITFICSDINFEIIEKIPYVHRIINFKVYSVIKDPIIFFKFIKELRKIKYDLVIDAGQWERINSIITIFVRKSYSIGFKTKGQWKHVINDAVVPHYRDKHEVENFMDLLMPLGIVPVTSQIPFDELQLEYFLKPEHRIFRDNFWKEKLLSDKIVLCFHPGCGINGEPRLWNINNYIKLAKKLHENYKNIRIIITGTSIEKEMCDLLYKATDNFSINTAAKYTIDQIAAIIERCELVICSNTGMLHVATCVGTPTIGLHGPTNPRKWGAYSENATAIQSTKFCSPCLYLGHDYGCNEPNCMNEIKVEDVYMAAEKKLKKVLLN